MALIFEDSELDPGTLRLPRSSMIAAIGKQAGKMPRSKYEAASADTVHATLINPFVAAVQIAFDNHLPLSLSPDQVWILLTQGFAAHVRENAEALRERFVSHPGRMTIRIIRYDFVRGQPNPWPELFGDFEQALRSKLGKVCDLVVADFTTTGPLERTVSQLVLMDAMQAYFRYEFVTRCGISRITLTGTPDDWRSIRTRAAVFAEYGLEWWTDALLPILDEFVNAAEGRTDELHWRSLYGVVNLSGGPYVTGWLPLLFPYLLDRSSKQLRRNPYLDGWFERSRGRGGHDLGPTCSEFPRGLSSIPVVWDYLGTNIPLDFLGGFAGVGQVPDSLEVTPKLGWAVRERPNEGALAT